MSAAPAMALSSPETEIEDMLKDINKAVKNAIERGWPPSIVGAILGSDLMIPAKLERGHVFRPSTIAMLHSRLFLLDIPPPPNNRTQRLLES
jgi:hypothetical protein